PRDRGHRREPPRRGRSGRLTLAGALAAALAVGALVLAARATSRVSGHLARLAPKPPATGTLGRVFVGGGALDLRQSGLEWTELDLLRAKIVSAVGLGLIASALALIVPLGPIVIVAAAYAGAIAPSLWVGHLASARRDAGHRLRASERARALDAAGRVEGRLMLVLVLCYLPALMLLVVIPLFVGLLDGLFV